MNKRKRRVITKEMAEQMTNAPTYKFKHNLDYYNTDKHTDEENAVIYKAMLDTVRNDKK